MLESLALPVLLSAVALFFASFLSWMVLQLHRNDWMKLPHEDGVMNEVRTGNLPPGRYMFPMASSNQEMNEPAFQRK